MVGTLTIASSKRRDPETQRTIPQAACGIREGQASST